MSIFARLVSWFLRVLTRSRMEQDMDAELFSHIEAHADDLMRTGMPHGEALRRARLEFGSVERAKDECRASVGLRPWDEVFGDARYGLRMLRKNPAFALVSILTLALGIGANAAIFSVVEAWILRPLPYPQAERLVYLSATKSNWPGNYMDISTPDFEDWRTQSHVFENMAVFKQHRYALTGAGDPEQVPAQQVSANFLRTLGVAPIMGRDFLPGEDSEGRERVAILTHEYWRDRFGAAGDIIGQTITLDGISYVVVGVLPPRFTFALGVPADVWVPLAFTRDELSARRMRWLNPIARLKAGVSVTEAQAEMSAIAARIALAQADASSERGVAVERLADAIARRSGSHATLLLFGATCMILLIACANVANLLLSRSIERRREVAVRAALGAGRKRLMRQFLVEALLMTGTACLLGISIALAAVKLLVARLPAGMLHSLPNDGRVSVNIPVLGFTVLVAICVGVIFGLLPALHHSRFDLQATLKEASGAISGATGPINMRRMLVVGEVALVTVVLAAAALLLESFSRLNALDPGFRPAHLLVAEVHLPPAKYSATPRIRDFFDQLLRRVRGIPGVVSAGAGSQLPFGGFSSGVGFKIPSHPTDEGQAARWTAVTPGYFSTMQIPLLAGRFFTDHDDAGSELVCIINEDIAKRFAPGQDPIGQLIDTADVRGLRVVGVVRQVKYWKLNDEPEPELYQPEWQVADQRMSIVVRTMANPLSIAATLRDQVWSLDKDQPVAQIQKYEQLISDRSAATRLNTQLMAMFAVLGLGLAATGIYGMIAYSVSQQTRDIGIRMALGADSRDASWMVVKQALVMVLEGLGLGVLGALAAGHILANMLYATSPTDPATYAMVTGILVCIACLSSWLPARRASQVDPMTVLRQE